MVEINEENFPLEWNLPTSDKKLRKAIYEAFKGKCFYSQRELTLENMHIDHVIPQSKGGPDNVYNYVLCEKEINLGKRAKLDWVALVPMLGIIRTHFVGKVQSFYKKSVKTRVNWVKPKKKSSSEKTVKKWKSPTFNFWGQSLFFPEEDTEDTVITFTTDFHRYEIRSALGLPDLTDMKVLYFLFSQVTDGKGGGIYSFGNSSLEGILQQSIFDNSLKKWCGVNLKFPTCVDSDEFITHNILKLGDGNQFWIEPSFYKENKYSSYQLFNLSYFNKFNSSFVARLYQRICTGIPTLQIYEFYFAMESDCPEEDEVEGQLTRALSEICEVTNGEMDYSVEVDGFNLIFKNNKRTQ